LIFNRNQAAADRRRAERKAQHKEKEIAKRDQTDDHIKHRKVREANVSSNEDPSSSPPETTRISSDGNPTLSTSVVVPGGLPRAIPVSAMPNPYKKIKTAIEEYNIYFITLIRVHLFGTCRVQVHRD
jgi:hypothetical protein